MTWLRMRIRTNGTKVAWMNSNLAIMPHMSYGDMRRYADTLGVTVCSDKLPGDEQGRYVRELNIIIIDRYMSYRVKRCALAHELIHWHHGDSSCNSITRSRQEHRARRTTASTLILTYEYAQAETEYDGDIYHMALELDVTKQVLKDYQDMVIPNLQILDRRQYA